MKSKQAAVNLSGVGPEEGGFSGKIVVQLLHGLGNRLCALLSTLVIADKLNLAVEVYWQRDLIACNALFEELFRGDGVEEVRIRNDSPPEVDWLDYGSVTPEMVAKTVAEGMPVYIRAFNFFGGALFGSFEYYERMRARLKKLRPVPAVQQIIDAVPAARIGFHARMTDHLPSRILTPRWCYREALKLVLSHFPSENVYVCSDTPSFVSELIELNPGRVFASPGMNGTSRKERSSLTELHAALAELWLLSRCKIILASPPSSFASLATVLSGGNFLKLSAWPDGITWRLEKRLWPLYRAVWYNLKSHQWQLAGNRGFAFPPVSYSAVLVARFACSKYPQDRPWPFLKRSFRKKILRALQCSESDDLKATLNNEV